MATYRMRKRIFYGGVYAALFFVLFMTITVLRTGPARAPEPSPTPPPVRKSINVEQVTVIPQRRAVDIVARLRNPNPTAGVGNLPVIFELKNPAGETIQEHTVNTYILPGSLQYAVAVNIPITQAINKATVTIPENITFQDLPSQLTLPSFNSFVQTSETKRLGSQTVAEHKGIVTNTSTLPWQAVNVIAIGVSGSGETISAGQTALGEMKVGEQREFTIQWPAPNPSTTRVNLFVSTNIFSAENILDITGDTGQLR